MRVRAGARVRMSAAWGASVIDISYLLLWERPGEGLQRFEAIALWWGAAASSIKPRSLVVLNLHVKENCVLLLRGESLIF